MQEPPLTRYIYLLKRVNAQTVSISYPSDMLCNPFIISVDFSQRQLDVPGITFNSLLASLYNPIVNPAMVSTVRFYDINELHRSPVVRNCQTSNYNYWTFFITNLISINWLNCRNITYPIVLEPYYLENQFWCLYLGIHCQGRRLNDNQSCMTIPN